MQTMTFNRSTAQAMMAGAAIALAVMLLVGDVWRVDAAPGDEDATFVPITACRLIDTRPGDDRVGPHGAFGIADTKAIAAHGTNGDCTIPSHATGLALNVTAISASAPTFLTFWPNGPRPKASSLNPTPGQPPTPNAVTTDLTKLGNFNVYNLQGAVDVIIDVGGYYTAASLQELTARVSALEAAQPFVVTARDAETPVTATAAAVVSVEVAAVVSGQVTVASSTNAFEGSSSEDVRCSITTGTEIDDDYLQWWESSGTGRFAQLAGTRAFDIPARQQRTYNLVCVHVGGSAGALVSDSVLTAIFTPDP